METEGPDPLYGTNGNDAINGLGGDDLIEGAGGKDTLDGGDGDDAGMWVITTERTDYHAVRQALEKAEIEVSEGGIDKIPNVIANPTPEEATKLMNLIDAIEDNEDVQKVYHNLDEDMAAEVEG